MNQRRKTSAAAAAIGAVAILAAAFGVAFPGGTPAQAAVTKPNIIVIFSDDQSRHELWPMQNVRQRIGAQGVRFDNAYITFPLCCPARATLLTGEYMHNHKVRGNFEPNGGWEAFKAHEPNSLPSWLQAAGYYTGHVGKYMNAYHAVDGPVVPPDWDEWYGRIGNERQIYYDYRLVERGPAQIDSVVSYGDTDADYSTDVYTGKALEFIDRASLLPTPFFLHMSVSAPHHPFTPARRHIGRFAGRKVVRPGFNEWNMRDKPRWLRREARERLRPALRRKIQVEQRRRLESMLAVDEGIGAILDKLEEKGIAQNTWVIYTSDNGLFRGEHRIAGGKYLPHEPSSHVPLLIRGPGVPAGARSSELVANHDIPVTIRELADVPEDPLLDGRSLLPHLLDPSLRTTRPLLLEGDTGPGMGIVGGQAEGSSRAARARAARAMRKRRRNARRAGVARKRGVSDLNQEGARSSRRRPATGDRAPAYRAIRTDRYLFVVYGTGDLELYDMARDPAQLQSRAFAKRYLPVRRWLFNNLARLARCDGGECREQIGKPPRPLNRKQLLRLRRR